MKAKCIARAILHVYDETREEIGAMLTADNQEIPVHAKTCKILCSCGTIFLNELIFKSEEDAA